MKCNLKLSIIASLFLLVFASLAVGEEIGPTEPWPKQPKGAPLPKELSVTRGLPPPSLGIPATLSIQFEFASAQLRPESIETLRHLGNALNQELKYEKVFVIEGHTDGIGTRQYNAVLSDRRAEAVKDYLVREMGVSPDRLHTVGKGSSEPADAKHPYAAENRRVVVINIGD
jgi:OOP family OmpA-OmpF porin